MAIGLYLSTTEMKRLKTEGWATCESKDHLEKIEPGIVQRRIESIGSIFEVADQSGAIHAKAKLVDAFVTTFGKMDMRLVRARGFLSDRARCQEEPAIKFPVQPNG
ncbi:MAG: hypothetical protein C5B49_06000 [Bdellovibrio sp.]|nr:MAG: hypothetical protein C5B49_06000 [Bdellovibrio sp.]